MNWLAPVADEDMNQAQQKVFARAKSKLELSEDQDAPDWLRVLVNSPEFLKDAYMNVSQHILKDTQIPLASKAVLATVAAAHAGNNDLAQYFSAHALAADATHEQIYEAMGIAATSTSFNFYYKFRSLAKTQDFDGFKAGLRATLFQRPAAGKAFAEMVNVMISAANGCASCVSKHIQKAERNDVSKAQIDEVIRIGAIVHSMSMFLRAA